jgi:hypothetical protein
MIRIAISAEAFDAIAAALPSGNAIYERERTTQGRIFRLARRERGQQPGKAARAARRGHQRRHRPAVRRACGQRADHRVASQ